MDPIPRSSLLKIPRQRRSAEMIHRVLDTGMELLDKYGHERFTTNHIADAAGISTGSLYQYFANKEMIVAGIVERSVLASQLMIRELFAAGSGLPADQLIRNGLTMLLAELAPYQNVTREIFQTQPLLSDTAVPAVVESFMMDVLRDYIINNADRYRFQGGVAAMYVAINSVVYMFLKWIVDPRPGIKQDEFLEALIAQVTSPIEHVST